MHITYATALRHTHKMQHAQAQDATCMPLMRQVEKHFPDGSKEITFPDTTMKVPNNWHCAYHRVR